MTRPRRTIDRLRVIYAREDYPRVEMPSIFLLGPTPRSEDVPSWRPDALNALAAQGFTGQVFVPEDRPDPDGKTRFKGDYDDQIEWEDEGLSRATVIMAYIPRNLVTMPALTSNVEWGVWQESGKIVLGSPEGAEKNRYLEHYAHKLGVPVSKTLVGTVANAIALLRQLTRIASDCTFCQIMAYDPGNQVVRSFRTTRVIMAPRPLVHGHALVVPRFHVATATTNPRVTGRVMADASTYASGIGQVSLATSISSDPMLPNPHMYVHVLPRSAGDGVILP